jgi:hypothetical protein
MTTTTITYTIGRIGDLRLRPQQVDVASPPLSEGAAEGNNPLSVPQRAIVIGEPIPIVFGRRVGDIGGIFISPGATEGRYANNTTTNDLTVNLELVLSDGELPGLLERDLYQRNCRVGTWGQAYNQRAGTWTPGNFITEVAGKKVWNCPLYCGTGGSYAGMSTLTFTKVYTELDDSWDKQIHAFIREGILVPRIIQNDVSSSNNVVDLAIYLIKKTSRFPDALIDTTAMLLAANFTNTNGFFYNGEYKKSGNLEDWLQDISTPFLLRLSDSNGKKGFIPRLPINNDYSIKTDAVTWEFTFTEEHVQPNGFQIQYVSLADRKPICAVVLWRQQPDDDVGLIRTSEVRMEGEAADGPFEQYDLSEFCTSELHAVKVGAYYVARRKYITHTLRLTVKPDAFNSTLGTGDLVRVTLRRETNVDDVSLHDYLYEVERISKDITGSIVLDLTHFPVNAAGAGLVNLAVANMTPNGITLPSGRNDFSCNVNNDNTAIPNSPGGTGGPGSGGGGDSNVPPEGETPPGPGVPNPGDPVAQPPVPEICGATGPDGSPLPGDELEVCSDVCEGQYNEWYLCDESPTVGATTVIHPSCVKITEGEGAKLIISPENSGKRVLVVGRCPDPASPDGYGEPQLSPYTPPVPEGDILVQGLGTYNVQWQRQITGVTEQCTPSTLVQCLDQVILQPCDAQIQYTRGANKFVSTSLITGFSASAVYGMRVISTPRTVTFTCVPGTSTVQLLSIISVSVQEELDGPWIDRVIGSQLSLGNDGTTPYIDEFGTGFNVPPVTTKAINIQLIKL